jgi:hypothetical protein
VHTSPQTIFSLLILAALFVGLEIGHRMDAGVARGEAQPAGPQLPDAAARRLERIQAELESSTHSWAGHYRTWRPGTQLWWAPSAGFVFQSAPHRGLGYVYEGDVQDLGQVLVLAVPDDLPLEVYPALSQRLATVRWGTRRYLIPETRMVTFCNHVNLGLERTQPSICYFLSDSERKTPEGLPIVPEQWRRYILPEPIECEVLEIRVKRKMRGNEPAGLHVEVLVSAGRSHGLLPGMHLVSADMPDLAWYKVEGTAPGSAIAILGPDAADVPSSLKIGAPMSTRRFVYPE